MIAFPNCKINLGLNIIRKREDGFHDLETIFLPIPFTDILEIISSDKTELTVTGLSVNTTDNLCIKAFNLLQQKFLRLPPIKMHLHKVIPMGAGLGGGSSDAAFTLNLLNEKFELNLKTEQLADLALQLGSDCPFFILNKPCFATGRGEILEPVNIDLKNHRILIVNPGIHIDTRWAFSKITPLQRNTSIKQVITQPIETWKEDLQNDFEVPVFAKYPEIKKIVIDLYEQGAEYASLSGSGSSVFGIFSKEKNIKSSGNKKYFYKAIDFN
jgi:4-diphosphocytidyl-2-C-methyl-D-erythritol kinase